MNYLDSRVNQEIVKSCPKEVVKETAKKIQEDRTYDSKDDKKFVKNVVKKVNKFLDKRAASKNVLRKNPQTRYVVQTKPTPYQDKSRFFKEKWEEEKRSLFFGK